MEYEEFIENYPVELQLIDAIDRLKTYSLDAAATLDRLVSHSTSEKTYAEPPQIDPNL